MDIIEKYINPITESEKILDNINNLTLDEIQNIIGHNIEKENTLMLAHIFNKLGITEQPVGCLVDDLKHQVKKTTCILLFSFLF